MSQSAPEDDEKCAVCGLTDEESEEGALWTECEKCEYWYHDVCAGIVKRIQAGGTWKCKDCTDAEALEELRKKSEGLKKEAEVLKRNQERVKRKAEMEALQKQIEEETRKLEQLKREAEEEREQDRSGGSGGGGSSGGGGGSSGSFGDSGGSSGSGVVQLLEQQARLVNRQFLVKLPEFEGNPEEWPLFVAQYKSSTRDGAFTPAENLTRLRNCLKGRARKAVEGLLSLPDNVNQVMEILELSFGSKELLVKAKLKSLSTLPTINENKPSTVRSFFEFVLNMKASLANSDAGDYLNSPQLLDSLVDKLPANLQRAWIKYKMTSNNTSLEAFIGWFKPLYQCAVLQDTESSAVKGLRVNAHHEESTKWKCPCCKKDSHKLPQCGKFKQYDTKKRWDFARVGKWCFICLSGRHFSQNCNEKKECGTNGCTEAHHSLLHKAPATTVSHHHDGPQTCYRSLPVTLYNGKECVDVWAFLDEGSGPTLLSEEVARKLNVSGPTRELCLKWSDGQRQQRVSSQTLSMQVSEAKGGKKFLLQGVQTVPVLDLPQPIDPDVLKERYKHLRDVNIPAVPVAKPMILIGLHHAKLMLPHKVREGGWNEPVASLTKLGWSVYGKAGNESKRHESYSCHICDCNGETERFDQMLKDFNSTECFGVVVPQKQLKSKEDELASELFERTIKFQGDRYEAGLLWKSPDLILPDNKSMAMKRLVCFEQKLEKDEQLKAAVLEKVASNIAKGYWQEADPKEINAFQGRKWFLPVFSVQNPNKPSSIRLVYDAAAKFLGVSLNEELIKGPDNLNLLLGVLLRFRRGKVGFGGDICEMFCQILIKRLDQFCQLILWRDLKKHLPPKIYKLVVMSFGAKSSPSTAIHVINLNATKFQKLYPRAYKAIKDHHYVDDYYDSCRSSQEAINLAKQVAYIHSQGGFKIRNWVSNSEEFMAAMSAEGSAAHQEVNFTFAEEGSAEKVLGLYWNTRIDCFVFKLSFVRADPEIVSQSKIPTKREVLRIIMSIFDPLGMLATVVISAKVLMQSLWRSGCGWDEKIPEEICIAWFNWLDSLKQIKDVKVPRWYSPNLSEEAEVELHVFADASEVAFATVAYVRISCGTNVSTSFVASKTRVAPQKSLSVPRLELQAAVLASRLAATIVTEIDLPLKRVVHWTDSQTVLGWLRSTHRRYTPFVSHRVSEILESTKQNSWRWVPSKKNVADDATKWENIPSITARWFPGPEFLLQPEDSWPVEKCRVNDTKEEARTIQFVATHREIFTKYSAINIERYSKWNRLLRAVGYVFRYITNLRSRILDKGRKPLTIEPQEQPKVQNRKAIFKARRAYLKELVGKVPQLNGDELETAKLLLFRKSQLESFADELFDLSKHEKVVRSSQLFKLSPKLDEKGIMRADTRLDAAPSVVDQDMRQPVILEGKHRITQLIIDSVHRRLHHSLRETVVNELRQKLWIPKIRVFVNRVVNSCTLCAVLKAKPKVPRMANLPRERLSPYCPPFTYTGLDYLGPFNVTVGRRHEKRWICLFTCLTMRAIHLEVASSLDTNSCVMCIRNFMNRRGRPHEFWSDNATNFKAAEKELKLMVDQLDKNEFMSVTQPVDPTAHQTVWKFIPPVAPHFGGSWERMVRTVKNGLYKVLKSRAPRDETFRSAVIEVEAIVNSRPLCYTTSKEITEPAITPNLLLRKSSNEPPNVPDLENFDSRKQWVISQSICQEFWNRWLSDYVPTIATRSKWFTDEQPLKIGQVVLLMETDVKRGEWRLGKVIGTNKSADGRVRSATVQTASSVYNRPVAKLAIVKDQMEI